MKPTTQAGMIAAQELPHFETCAGLRGPNACDCGVVAHILAIEGQQAVGRRARLAKVLTDWNIDALTSDPPHGWRCEYPESYGKGPCDCIARLLDDLVAT